MAKQKNFFGVSVEEALTRSGVLDSIIEYLQNITSSQLTELHKNNAVLKQNIVLIEDKKETIKKQSSLLKQCLKSLKLVKRESTQNSYVLKIEQYSNSLSQLKNEINKLIKETFILEHQMLDEISGGITKTATYAIYFYGKENPQTKKKEIIRGEIKAEDLYNSEQLSKYLYIDSKGSLKLSAQIIKVEQNFEKISKSTISENVYDPNLAVDLEGLAKETYIFFQDIQEKYLTVKSESVKKHLGNARDAVFDASKAVQDSKEEVLTFIREKQQAMYNYLFLDNKLKPKGRINKGHLAEAYERILKARLSGKEVPSYYNALQASLGDDPWYISGDVGDTQVKSFFDNNDRRIASYSSIISLGKNLSNLIDDVEKSSQEIREKGKERILGKREQEFEKGTADLTDAIYEEIQMLFKQELKLDK